MDIRTKDVTRDSQIENAEHRDCDHVRTGPWEGVKEYLGEKFSYSTTACLDCPARLWTSEIDAGFQSWRQDLFQKRPELFEITLRLTPENLDKLQFARHFFDTENAADTIHAILCRTFETAFGPAKGESKGDDRD